MDANDFPPFDLDQYRMIYMEKTESIVKCTVKLDEQSRTNRGKGAMMYEAYGKEVSELILRLLLFEESYGRTHLALPDSFLVLHQDYVLRIETRPWTTPHRFRFFRRFADQFTDSAKSSSQSQTFINHQRLVCWPFKYTITFTPRPPEDPSVVDSTLGQPTLISNGNTDDPMDGDIGWDELC